MNNTHGAHRPAIGVGRRPNILFILPDQQRPDSLGFGGSTAAQTPHLDALAAGGVVFDNCYVQNPLCCPSRYSILTGRYPHSHGVRANWYAPRPGEISFAHQVGRVGYRSAAIGKMHFTPWNDRFGFDGRIIAEAKFQTDCPDDYERFLNAHGSSRSVMYDLRDPAYIQDLTALTSRLPQELHIDSFVGLSACEYLRSVPESTPFCAFVSFLSPHNPYDPPSPYDRLFKDRPGRTVDLPARNMRPGEIARKPREAYDYINRRLTWPFKSDEISETQRRSMVGAYYALNTLVDDWVGRIVATLKERALYDNTVIIYASDHGDLLGDHGLYYKQCFYEQSVRVPFFVHAPALFAPQRIADPVELMNVYATICELAGADVGPANQSVSLVPTLQTGRAVDIPEAAFSENYFGRMVRTGDWKLVYYPGKPYGEIYNLADDPDEQENLWEPLRGSAIKTQLTERLLEWAFAAEDPTPLPVRADHFDAAPRDFDCVHGATRERLRQSWYLPELQGLYEHWDFTTSGRVRE